MTDLPTGTVTFVFTDIEESTRLVATLGERYPALLDRHHALLRSAFTGHEGVEVMTEGDAFFVVFRSPLAAVQGAVAAQRAIHQEDWPAGAEVRVRMGLHTGEALLGGDNYVGLDVHRAARISGAAHGGQVLLSGATAALVEQALPDDLALRDLGEHRLKDLPRAERVYQLDAEGLPATFPAIRSLDARPNNLPAPMTSFIGREHQIEEVKQRLSTTRLLTLTGPGGTGKTRLSIRVAEEVLPDYRDGCWFVALDALRDPDLVPSAIAAALRVQLPPDRPVVAALESWLESRELLVVLDNFEQVTAAARHVSQLLAAAAGLRVLATSRTPLHIYGEAEYAVPPLGTASELVAAGRSAEALSQYEAVRLFIERAIAVKPDFRVTNDNAPALAELCARLDGLPLAIELAAVRVKLLSVEQILARLDSSLALLASGVQDQPERQRTLHGAIDWSVNLLPAAERRLFARLSVFRGGFTLTAAEDVCADETDIDVFEGLASLVDKSLLRTDDGADETRFSMLETIRRYAAEKLDETGEGEQVRRRHGRHFLDLAVTSEPHLTGAAQLEWLGRLDRERDNLRAALDRASDLGLVDEARTAAGAMWRYWQQRGQFAEARAIFERLLAAPDGAPAARAKALSGAGGVAYWQGDFEAVGRWYGEARALYESVGDRAGLAAALYNESYVPALGGELEQARQMLAQSRDLYRDVGDQVGEAMAETMLGFTHYFEARPADALPFLERAVAIYRRTDARWQLADTLTGLGFTRGFAGDWQAAMAAIREALAIFRESANEVGIAMIAEGVAAAAAWVGQAELSARLFGAAEQIKQRVGGGAPAQFAQVERFRATAIAGLGVDDFARLNAEGAQLSPAQIAELVESYEPPADAPAMPAPQPWGAAAEAEAAAD